jgi:ComF family protein
MRGWSTVTGLSQWRAHAAHAARNRGQMPLGAAFGGLLAPALGWLAPALCWGCGQPVRRDEALCRACRGSFHRLAPEAVLLSGVRVWAPVAYAGPARDLVRALKFRGAIGVADAMAAQIVANAPPDLLEGGTVVPVPLHPKRMRSRGYNQASAIAEAVALRAGLEVADCLLRSGPPMTQMGRHRSERRAGPVGEIECLGGVRSRVLLIDDVVTTGATLAACRAALVARGAVEVAAVVFARTIGR